MGMKVHDELMITSVNKVHVHVHVCAKPGSLKCCKRRLKDGLDRVKVL